MANPRDTFEATDVISGRVPRMRLIFAGVGKGKSFVHYEQGGRSYVFILALFKFPAPSSAGLSWRAYCSGRANNLAELRSKVLNRECQ